MKQVDSVLYVGMRVIPLEQDIYRVIHIWNIAEDIDRNAEQEPADRLGNDI